MALLAQWHAELGITLNGSDVSSWTDQVSGYNLVQATGALQPAYITDVNGHNALRAAASEFMRIASTATLDWTTGTRFIIAVIKRATSMPSGFIAGKSQGGSPAGYRGYHLYIGTGGNAGKAVSVANDTGDYRGYIGTANSITADALHTVGMSLTLTSGANNNVYRDGATDNITLQSAGAAPTTTTNSKSFSIFEYDPSGPTDPFTGDLYELRVYDAIPADVAALHTELYGYWNSSLLSGGGSGPGCFMGSPTWSKRPRKGRRR